MKPKPSLKRNPGDIARLQAALALNGFNGSNGLFESAAMICCSILNAGKAAGNLDI